MTKMIIFGRALTGAEIGILRERRGRDPPRAGLSGQRRADLGRSAWTGRRRGGQKKISIETRRRSKNQRRPSSSESSSERHDKSRSGQTRARRRDDRGGQNGNQLWWPGRAGGDGHEQRTCSDTMLGIDLLYSRGAKGHNI
jgi:hypothetical protein